MKKKLYSILLLVWLLVFAACMPEGERYVPTQETETEGNEELTNTGEETEPTTIPKITRVTTEPPPANWSADKLEELRKVSFASDDAQTVEILKSLVLQTPPSEPPSTP